MFKFLYVNLISILENRRKNTITRLGQVGLISLGW